MVAIGAVAWCFTPYNRLDYISTEHIFFEIDPQVIGLISFDPALVEICARFKSLARVGHF